MSTATGVSTEQRFWAKVRKTDTCWLWTGTVGPGGYGRFHSGKQVRVHRYAYRLLVGPIPRLRTLDHLCRVKLCVNPDHLEPVRRTENTRRMLVANYGFTVCRRCGDEILGCYTFCKACWADIPDDRKAAIKSALVPGTVAGRQASPAYLVALDAAFDEPEVR
jgi:hypothetical protein